MVKRYEKMDQLIFRLADKGDYLTARDLADSLSCSEKTIYRLVKEINADFSSDHLIKVHKRRGYRLNNETYLKHYRFGRNLDDLTPLDRQDKLLERLLLSAPKALSIYDLCQDYFVSEAVIAKDRLALQERLADYDLKLSQRRGYLLIQGEEVDLRRALADLVATFQTIDLDQLDMTDGINQRLAKFINAEIKCLESRLQVHIPYPYNINIFSHIYILLERAKKRRRASPYPRVVEGLKTEDILLLECIRLISSLETFLGYAIDEVEICYLYQYLISSRFQKASPSYHLHFSQRVVAVTRFYFEKMPVTADKEVTEDSQMFIDLAQHISPMLRRLDNKIRIKNKLLDQIRLNYPDIFAQVQEVSDQVSQRYGFPKINPDEVSFLSLYFARFMEIQTRPIKTLIMCSSGIGTSELLKSRVERSFSDLAIVGVVAYQDLDQLMVTYPDLELIVTTIDLTDQIPVPTILVSALLTVEDRQGIQKVIEEIQYG